MLRIVSSSDAFNRDPVGDRKFDILYHGFIVGNILIEKSHFDQAIMVTMLGRSRRTNLELTIHNNPVDTVRDALTQVTNELMLGISRQLVNYMMEGQDESG